jgi:hypothetical protein
MSYGTMMIASLSAKPVRTYPGVQNDKFLNPYFSHSNVHIYDHDLQILHYSLTVHGKVE